MDVTYGNLNKKKLDNDVITKVQDSDSNKENLKFKQSPHKSPPLIGGHEGCFMVTTNALGQVGCHEERQRGLNFLQKPGERRSCIRLEPAANRGNLGIPG